MRMSSAGNNRIIKIKRISPQTFAFRGVIWFILQLCKPTFPLYLPFHPIFLMHGS